MPRRPKTVPLARMSPSGANAWMNCPGWAQAVAHIEPKPADPRGDAALGTAAHKLFQTAAVLGVPASTFDGDRIDEFTVDDDMIDAVQVALDWLHQWWEPEDVKHYYELSMKMELGGYEMTGTTDYVGTHADTVHVLDYKHGQGRWVDAEANVQVGIYIIMAMHHLGISNPTRMVGTIAQPRAARTGSELVRSFEWSLVDIKRLRERVSEALHEATIPGAPRRAGTHCHWCPAAATCRELAEYSIRTAMTDFQPIESRPVITPDDPATLTNEGLAFIMERAPIIEAWLRSVQAEIYRRLARHTPVPGFKLVLGRSIRQWANDKTVVDTMQAAGFTIDEITELSVKSPATLLKLVKKSKDEDLIARMNGLVVKSRPPLHVVPEADPRPAATGTASLDFTPVPGA